MAQLLDVSTDNIGLHIKNIYEDGELVREATTEESSVVQIEGGREVQRPVTLYNLDAILAVGYRVRSPRGVQFRRWASTVLKEYLLKGFAMDDERLKNPDGRPDHFDEMLERIRGIRASEKRFYQKVRDLFTLSTDYDKTDRTTQQFFATVQNVLLYAVTRQTAAELITTRANPADPKSSVSRKLGKKPTAPPSFAVILADVGQIATVGDNSVAVAGLAATLDEKKVSTASAGDHGCAITARKGMATVCAFSASVAGDNSQSRASTSGMAMAGIKSYAEVGNWGVAFAKEGSTVLAGTGGVACCLPTDPRVTEKKSFCVAAASGGVAIMLVGGGMAQGGVGCVLIFGYLDPTTGTTILKVGQTQDIIDTPQAGRLTAGIPYRLNPTTHQIEPLSARRNQDRAARQIE